MRQRVGGLPYMLELAVGCAASAAAAKIEAQRPPWPLNPFPRGIREGSATEAVLNALSDGYPRWFENCELMRLTGRSRGAVAWALGYLAEHGLVRSIPSARHPQYRRYQGVLGSQDKSKTRESADDADRN